MWLFRRLLNPSFACAVLIIGFDSIQIWFKSFHKIISFYWLNKAADNGYPDAQYDLGVRFANGEIVSTEKKQLIKECDKYGIYTDDLKSKLCEFFKERIFRKNKRDFKIICLISLGFRIDK